MALFIAKPVLWNNNGYVRPAGMRAHSGFPALHGFGHEEWNNSPALLFSEDGVEYRAFHTEGVGQAPVSLAAGRTFVFMYASHHRAQYLVGVAGNATCLMPNETQRKHLTQVLNVNKLADEAWALPLVKSLHHGDHKSFLDQWRGDRVWIPNWRCPADTYLWLQQPALLDAQALRGKSKLLTMFGSHTEFSKTEATKMMTFVPPAERTAKWCRILAGIDGPERDYDATTSDILQVGQRRDIPKTTREQLIEARLGQGRFRRDVELLWGVACAVSGCTVRQVLRASHIKAWSKSTDAERLDASNGLLLTAELDALFDRGLISFAADGTMLISPQLSTSDRKLLRLPRPLRNKPSEKQQLYLSTHRVRWGF